MINWSRLSIERKMEISNEMRAFIKNNYMKEDSVLIGASKREIFKKPNGTKTSLSNSIHNHIPKTGDMIIFPNNLMHTAYPFNVEGERRSFSFNLDLDNKTKKLLNV